MGLFAAMVLVLTGCPGIRGQLGRFFPTQLIRQVIDLLSPRFWAADSFRDTKAVKCRVNRAFGITGQLQNCIHFTPKNRLWSRDLADDSSDLDIVLALFLAGHHCVGYLPESQVRREGATTSICAINKLWVTEGLFVSPYAQKDGIVCLRRWYLPFRFGREAPGPQRSRVPSSGLPSKHNPRAHAPSPLPGGTGGTL